MLCANAEFVKNMMSEDEEGYVTLKPKKPTEQDKIELMEQLKNDILKYNAIYLFSHKDMRLKVLSTISQVPEWQNSKVWYAKNNIVQNTLVNFETTHPGFLNLKELSEAITHQSALLLTDRPQREVVAWFNTFSIWDYPLCGYEVDVTIKLQKGPLRQFSPQIEPHLRETGMPTTVVNGVVMLLTDFEVCRAGTILTSKQIHYLQLLGEKLAVFKLQLKAKWTKELGLEVLGDEEDSEDEQEGYDIL